MANLENAKTPDDLSDEKEQPLPKQKPTRAERNSVVGWCVLSLMTFFFPLLTIQIPIVGQTDLSGYDVFSRLTELREEFDASGANPLTNPNGAKTRTLSREIPLSIWLGALIPLAVFLAFISPAISLMLAFKTIDYARLLCFIGAVCAGFAIVHISILNSDIHSWIGESTKAAPTELKDIPFAELADNIGKILLNAFQIKPAWGIYTLFVFLVLGSVRDGSQAAALSWDIATARIQNQAFFQFFERASSLVSNEKTLFLAGSAVGFIGLLLGIYLVLWDLTLFQDSNLDTVAVASIVFVGFVLIAYGAYRVWKKSFDKG